jgi:dolichol kinase
MVAERTRKLVHVATAGGALMLPHIPWSWSLSVATVTVATIAALALAPASRLGGRRLHPASLSNLVGYALGVSLLVAAFPTRPDLAAAGWGILAAGDAAATLAGRRFVGRRWPWHPQKTLAGSTAFVLAGGTAGLLLACLTRPPNISSTLVFTAFLVAAASVIAAAVETIPIPTRGRAVDRGCDDTDIVARRARAATSAGGAHFARHPHARRTRR